MANLDNGEEKVSWAFVIGVICLFAGIALLLLVGLRLI